MADEAGHIVESGSAVLDEIWHVSFLAYRRFLVGERALAVWAEPSGLYQEPEQQE